MKKSFLTGTFCASVTAFTLCLVIPASAIARDYLFTKIVDTNDANPGGTGNFTGFDLPSLDGRDLAIGASGINGYSGIFTYIGGNLNLVADSNTSIPGGVGNFDTVELPIIDNGNVVFASTQNFSYEAQGIYTDLGGSLRVIADHNTPIPGGTGNFGFFTDEDHYFGNGVAAFNAWASEEDYAGGYAEINGTLTVVVDDNTPHPDGGNFRGGSVVGVDGANVAFDGGNSVAYGIYLNNGGTISTIIDENTLRPGSTETFSIGQAEVDAAESTFVFEDNFSFASSSLYSNVGGTLHLVAEIGDTTPDGIGNFIIFDNLAVDGDELAFTAAADNGDGSIYRSIYRYFEGVLDEVISESDMLDGKSVVDLNMYFAGLDDGAIALRAEFGDGSSGIYLAEVSNVPLPASVWLFGSGLLGLVEISRRKKAA